MNIIIKLPALLGFNVLFTILPGLENFLEQHLLNIYHFGSDHNSYSHAQYADFIKRLVRYASIKNKILLEIGPGGSIGLGLLALKNGAKKYLAVDTGNHLSVGKNLFTEYSHLLKDDALTRSLLTKRRKNYVFNSRLIKFFDITQNSAYDLPANSVDIIYSCAVLEHVHDLDLCFREMSRVLKPGGLMNHIVDLRDHVFSQKSLFFLTIPEVWFRLLFGKTGSFVNRKRYSDYSRVFSRYNLEVLHLDKQILYDGKICFKLFKMYTRNDLQLLSFNIVLRKKI